MVVLDCESPDSTLQSLSAIYRVPASEIEAMLRGFDLRAHYQRFDPTASADDEIRAVFESELSVSPGEIDRTYWFHLTRTRSDASFVHGILPLTEALDLVWTTVTEFFSGTIHEQRLRHCRANGVSDLQYGHKTADPLHAGPYAMLVKEAAFRSDELGNHDYLGLPEIVEDICNGYEKQYGEQLHDRVRAALTPTIVKFWSAKQPGSWCIGPALLYLHCRIHNGDLHRFANACFDGGNQAIPSSQILRIERIRER